MAHIRKRHLLATLRHLEKASPLVGLLGHRQVGKTTLLEQLAKNYVSLDDLGALELADKDPIRFLEVHGAPGTAIDECQLAPGLFPSLKERVRRNKRPGQYFLSGSVRFTSRKIIRESLTGRIMTEELLPFTLSELSHRDLPDHLLQLLARNAFSASDVVEVPAGVHRARMKLVSLYLTQGGLPGVCFLRSEKLRRQRLEQQLQTILSRDLRQVYATGLALPRIMDFLRVLALEEGRPVQYQAIRRATGITPNTQKHLIRALEATFILRILPLEGDSSGEVYLLEDQGESHWISRGALSEDQQWSGLVYRNLREQTQYQVGSDARYFQFRTRSGVEIPFAIEDSHGVLGVVPTLGVPTRSERASAASFLRHYGRAKVLFVSKANFSHFYDSRVLCLPATHLLF